MHVVVFTRSTPHTEAKIEVGADGAVSWDSENVANPWDEYALEEAIIQSENAGGNSTVIALGGEMHDQALRHSLSLGLKNAIRIEADNTDDSLTYARLSAAAAQKLGDVDLIINGKESVDVGTDAHIYQMARKLGWPMLSYVAQIVEVDYDAGTIKVERLLEQGRQIVTSKLPAVISVVKDINEPRYPSFMNIRRAGKAEIPVWTAADLGVELPAARTNVTAYHNLPKNEAEVEMLEGTPQEMAATLVARLLEEKVI
jgi:electron transfer flavoprotein beta subunit